MSGRRAYLVLGMHRSGTSSVAGAISMLGAAPPSRMHPPKEENPRGFFESVGVTALNNQILLEGGSDWYDWRPFDMAFFERPERAGLRHEARARLAAEFGEAKTIVLKDPRMCRFFPFWRSVLEGEGYEVLVVSPVRRPHEVAASMTRRDGCSRELGLRAWTRHVLEAEAATRGSRRAFIVWMDFLADWRREMGRAATAIGLPVPDWSGEPEAAVDAFLTRALRRNREPVEPGLPARVWNCLVGLARSGEDEAIHARLDNLKARFDEACALFDDAPLRLRGEDS